MKERAVFIPEELEMLARLLKKSGTLYIVGGYVRNALLKIDESDIDLASAISPETIRQKLQNTKFTVKEKSKRLGTIEIKCKGYSFEHTTFRKEIYEDNGTHCPIAIEQTTDIKEDAKRRDFTINAIYYDILNDKIVDLYTGVNDLNKRILRSVETPPYVFDNDGLRILRMIRLASELNFKIDRNTLKTAYKMSYKLQDITGSRKMQELNRILQSPNRYSITNSKSDIWAFKMFNKLGLWSNFYMPITKVPLKLTKKVDQQNRFLGLLVDIVKAVNPDSTEIYLHHLLDNGGLAVGNKNLKYYVNIVCGYYDAINGKSNKQYFFKYFQNFATIGKLLQKGAPFVFNKYNFFYKYIINHHLPIVIKDLKINGRDIKEQFPELSGKNYKTALEVLLEKVFDGKVLNEKDALLKELNKDVNSGNY